MTDSPSPIRYMRREVFGVTQEELAAVGGVSRPRISRYESGLEDPPYRFMARLRAEAKRRGLSWDSDWFFSPPAAPAPVVAPAPSLTHVRAAEDCQ